MKCLKTEYSEPGIVNLEELKSGFMTNQMVRWDYLGSDECSRTYRVEYWNKYKGYKEHIYASRFIHDCSCL